MRPGRDDRPTTSRARGRGRRRSLRLVATLAALAVLVAGAAGCRPEARHHPILLVHGWSATGGTSCSSTFDPAIADLRAQGFTGPIVKVGYYTGDTGCDMTLRDWGTFDNSSSWKEVAKAFSQYVHDTYTVQGVAVDVVGYSMGANIVRGAVLGAGTGEDGFSPPIIVQDAVTLGGTHNGAAWYSSFCLWGQCSHLKPGAAHIQWLNTDMNPQGRSIGTDWTVIGSHADAVVPVDSATHMDVPAARVVVYQDVPHTGGDNYLGRSDVLLRTGEALAKPGV